VSRVFCFTLSNDLPEDVDGDAEEDDEDEANDDESEHPVAQDSSICPKKIRFIKGTIRERLLFRAIVAGAFSAVIYVILLNVTQAKTVSI